MGTWESSEQGEEVQGQNTKTRQFPIHLSRPLMPQPFQNIVSSRDNHFIIRHLVFAQIIITQMDPQQSHPEPSTHLQPQIPPGTISMPQNGEKVYRMSLEQVQAHGPAPQRIKNREIRCGIREGCEDINTFRRLNRIHEGVYGVVYRAEDTNTKQIVAIKKLKLVEGSDFPITSLRQIAILKSICHDNIIKIKKISGNAERDRVFIVMQYMDHEMKALLKMQKVFSEEQVRRLMKDLLLGIECLHQRGMVHRDLKTSNLLYSNDGILKICDFGLARRVSPYMMTQEVITLWYRAPQLLLGPALYSTQIDIWSIGCIFAQLVLGEPLFQGKVELEHLDQIFKVLGSPTEDSWPNYKQLKNAMYVVGNKYPENKLRQAIPKEKLSDAGIDLLKRLLTPYPKKRITADKALKHDWFKEPIAQRSQMPSCAGINEMDRVKKVQRV